MFMSTIDVSSITEYGVIGVCLVAVVMWLRSYVTKMDEHQNQLTNTLLNLLTDQTQVMNELKNSITELTSFIKSREDDGK